jgi:hypothetical protein
LEKRWNGDLEEDDPKIEPVGSLRSVLWEFCRIGLKFRKQLRMRQHAWPYNDTAVVPYVSLPTMRELRANVPVNSNKFLPLPYSDHCEQWLADYNRSVVKAPEYFTTGTWRGYYSFSDFFMISNMLDPPMTGIKFRRVETASDEIKLVGENGGDGEGPFNLHLTLKDSGGEVDLRGDKRYLEAEPRWDWELKLTPLGLIGKTSAKSVLRHR